MGSYVFRFQAATFADVDWYAVVWVPGGDFLPVTGFFSAWDTLVPVSGVRPSFLLGTFWVVFFVHSRCRVILVSEPGCSVSVVL